MRSIIFGQTETLSFRVGRILSHFGKTETIRTAMLAAE